MSVVSEGVFRSALQPNSSTVSTYAVPSENQLAHGGTLSDTAARNKRVQQQVALRMAEKSSLPRRTASPNYASSGKSAPYPPYPVRVNVSVLLFLMSVYIYIIICL